MTFVDTSSWVNYFKGEGDQLKKIDDLLHANKAVVNSVVLFELMPAIIKHKENKLLELLRRLRCFDTEFNLEKLTQYQVKNMRSGINSVGLADMMILDTLLTYNLPILYCDRHFGLMKSVFHFETR